MTGWKVATLGELADRSGGQIKTGPFGSQLHQSDYLEVGAKGVAVVMPKDMVDGRIAYETIARISSAKAGELSIHIARPGDVLLARRGEIGRSVLIRDVDSGVFCGTGSLRVSLQGSELLSEFLFRYLSTVKGRHQLEGKAVGATMPNINADIVRSMEVRFPPLPVQERIVGLLSSYDELIENNTRRIQILTEMAHAIYREWFLEFRYSGHESVPLVDSHLGPIPEGWQIASTADLIADGTLEIGDGYRAKNAEFGATGLPFLRAKNLRDDFDFGEVDFMPFEALHRVGRKRSQTGDCVITMKGTVGRVGFVSELTPEFVYSPQLSYWRVLGGDALDRTYLRVWMEGPEFGQQCVTVKGSTDMADYVNLKDQRRMRITLPRRDLQERFSEAVAPMFDLVTRLRVACQNLRASRDLLLPRLVSGEIDVSKLDIDVGDAAA